MSQNRPTIRNCVWHALDTADEETLKEMLAISELGKEYLEIQDEKQKSNIRNTLSKGLNRAQLIGAIIQNMESAITEGFGIMDVFKDMDLYPKQLQHCIEVLTKGLEKKAEELGDEGWKRSLKITRDKYSSISLTCDTAVELEEVIVTLLLDAHLKTLSEKEREKLIRNIARELKGLSGVDEGRIASILTYGGLIALRQLLGFNFHIILAVVINTIWKYTGAMILGSGLSLAVNALIQRLAAIVLGPIGWVIFTISLFSLGSKLLNPREYDKYIPLVVYIYILRLKIKEYLKDFPE